MHTLICGVTLSGKTTLAHIFAHALDKAGENIIVFDPVGTETAAGVWPELAVKFEAEEELFGYLAQDDVSNCQVFIDEAAEVFSHSKKHNQWLLTRGRHFGFSVWLIAQRPKMIAPNARTQCGHCYMFRLAQDDAREVGADFGHSHLEKIVLDKGDYLSLRSGSASIKRANVFDLVNPKRKDSK